MSRTKDVRGESTDVVLVVQSAKVDEEAIKIGGMVP